MAIRTHSACGTLAGLSVIMWIGTAKADPPELVEDPQGPRQEIPLDATEWLLGEWLNSDLYPGEEEAPDSATFRRDGTVTFVTSLLPSGRSGTWAFDTTFTGNSFQYRRGMFRVVITEPPSNADPMTEPKRTALILGLSSDFAELKGEDGHGQLWKEPVPKAFQGRWRLGSSAGGNPNLPVPVEFIFSKRSVKVVRRGAPTLLHRRCRAERISEAAVPIGAKPTADGEYRFECVSDEESDDFVRMTKIYDLQLKHGQFIYGLTGDRYRR